MVAKLAKILIVLIVISCLALVSVFLYQKLNKEPTLPAGTEETQPVNKTQDIQDIKEYCSQSYASSNASVGCITAVLMKRGYVDEAKEICEQQTGVVNIRCRARILALQNMTDEAIKLCGEMPSGSLRNTCIVNSYSNKDDAMEFCLSLSDKDQTNLCIANEILSFSNNVTKDRIEIAKYCDKIETLSIRESCMVLVGK